MKSTSTWAGRAVSRLLVMFMAALIGLGPAASAYAQDGPAALSGRALGARANSQAGVAAAGGAIQIGAANFMTAGDSRQAAGSATTVTNGIVTTLQFQQRGWQTHVKRLTGQRVDFPASMNVAVASTTTADMVATQLPQILPVLLARGAAGVVVLDGTNDPSNGLTAAQSIANLTTFRDAVLATGAYIVWVAELPRGDSGNVANRLTSPSLEYHMAVHRWLLAQKAVPRSYVANPWPTFADPTSATGDAILGLTYDGLHPNGAGAQVIAATLAPIFNTLIPPVDFRPSSNADIYSANNTRGSLTSNPMMTGTGGSTVAGGSTISGTVADGYTVTGVNATGLTIVASKETVNGEEFQKVVITGTPTVSGVNVEVSNTIPIANLTANATTGDRVYALAQIDIPAGNTNWNGVALGVRFLTSSGTPTTLLAQDGSVPAPTTQVGPALAQTGVMRTSPIMISQAINSSSTANSRARLIIYPIVNQVVNITVRVRCLTAFKDIDNALVSSLDMPANDNLASVDVKLAA